MAVQETSVQRRKRRLRFHLRQRAFGIPRLSVFRSNRYIYAQVIDDLRGHTLACASTLEKNLSDAPSSCSGLPAAEFVGRLVAQRAKSVGVLRVVFDRGSYRYHGKVKALAEAARAEGLQF